MLIVAAYLFDMRVCECVYITDRQQSENEMMKYVPQTHVDWNQCTHGQAAIKNIHTHIYIILREKRRERERENDSDVR
jgi:hypothetical protein